MTLQYDANFVPATFAEAIFRWKEHLKSVGWEIQASSDSLTFSTTPGNANDQINSFSSGAGGMANYGAWFVIQQPGGSRQFCVQRGNDNQHWFIKYSILPPGFTGGTPSFTEVPSSADEKIITGDGPDASPTFAQISQYPDGQQTFTIAADDAAPYGFWAGGYGYNLQEWFKAGGDFSGLLPTVPSSNQNVADTLAHAPSPRDNCAMAHDKTRIETVLFGGSAGGGFLVTDQPTETWIWSGNPRRWRCATTTKRPPWRRYHAMAYDEINQRVIMFGGTGASVSAVLNDTWSWDGFQWTQLFPATSPSARLGHAMVFSPALGQIVMFGGNADPFPTIVNDTWTWNGADWVLLHNGVSGAPTARTGHALAIDPVNGRILMHGGSSGASETWQFNTAGNTWTNVTPADPNNISEAHTTIAVGSNGLSLPQATINVVNTGDFGASYFPSSGTVKVVTAAGVQTVTYTGKSATSFTGCTGGAGLMTTGNKVFVVNGRSRARMVLDVGNSLVRLFGGSSIAFGYLADTWSWNGTTWTLSEQGAVGTKHPGLRADYAMEYDFGNGEVAMFGGYPCFDYDNGADGVSDVTWIFDGSAWDRQRSCPKLLGGARMANDSVRGRVVMFGGHSQNSPGLQSNLTWEWDGTRWVAMYPTTKPPPRQKHSMAFDSSNAVVVMFGGAGSGVLGDTWKYDGSTWTNPIPGSSPSARFNSAMAFDEANGKTVLYGGSSGSAETWEWNNVTWTQKFPATNPGVRSLHSMAYHAGLGVTILFGDSTASNQETWSWNGTNWTQIFTATSPPGRAGSCMVYDQVRDRILLFGDHDPNGNYGTQDSQTGIVWVFDGSDWSMDRQYFCPSPRIYNPGWGPITLSTETFQTGCAAFHALNGRTVFYCHQTTWYSGKFNGPGSGFLIFDPIKNPLPGDPDPYVVVATTFDPDPNAYDKNNLLGLFQESSKTSAWASHAIQGAPFSGSTERWGRAEIATSNDGTFGANTPGGLSNDPAFYGAQAPLFPVFWVVDPTTGRQGIKGESSLLMLPGRTYGFGGTAISTTGESSRDFLAIKAGIDASIPSTYSEGRLYRRSIAFPWNGSAQIFSDDINGPFSGNTEALSVATGEHVNMVAPVQDVAGVIYSTGLIQASLIDDEIPAQEPIAEAGGTGSVEYRMRGFDVTLDELVFWTSDIIDASGTDYAGPGPLTGIVVQMLIGS